MRDRIEILYSALDEMARCILKAKIPLSPFEEDPNRPGKGMEWPETFLAYKQKVQGAEESFGREEPLTPLQWRMAEMYLTAQYGFPEIPGWRLETRREKRRD